MLSILFFFFNETATTAIYTYLLTLSLHDALPICRRISGDGCHVSGPNDRAGDIVRRIGHAALAPVSSGNAQATSCADRQGEHDAAYGKAYCREKRLRAAVARGQCASCGLDRKCVVEGTSVYVRVALGGRRVI